MAGRGGFRAAAAVAAVAADDLDEWRGGLFVLGRGAFHLTALLVNSANPVKWEGRLGDGQNAARSDAVGG